MCESSAYILKNGKEELLLESVDILEDRGGEIKIVSVFGEAKSIKGKVKSLSLLEHKIVLELS